MATFNYRIDNVFGQAFKSNWGGVNAPLFLPDSAYSSSYASQNYSALIKYGDTINLTVGYGGQGTIIGNVINYLYYPYSTSNLGYPQPSSTTSSNPATSNGGAIPSKTFSRTWSGYSDYYAHWYFFNGSTANNNAARNQFRILAIPTSSTHMAGNGDNNNSAIMRISSISNSIIRGTGTGNANIDVPTAFLPYINSTFQGSYYLDQNNIGGYHTENLYGADGSYGGTGELFSWYIYNSNGTLASTSYFSARDGTITGNQFNNSGRYVLSISPTSSCPLGTYYLELHHWDTTPEYPSSGSGTGAIFSPTSSNTRIARRAFTVTDPVRITNVTLSGSTSTSSNADVVVRDAWVEPLQVTYVHRVSSSDQTGFEGTIYYTLPSPLSTYGWSTSTYVQNQSGWLARSYTSTAGQTYKYMTETQGFTDAINSNGITVGSSQTYYVVATDGNSQNVADTGQTYQVDRPKTSVTLVGSGTGVTFNSYLVLPTWAEYDVPSSTTSVTVQVQNNGNTTYYRLRRGSTTGSSVGEFDGNGVSTSGFTVSGTELPTAGNSEDYYCEAKIETSDGGLNTYIDTLRRIRLTRTQADTSPDQFDLGGPNQYASGTTYGYSNTITISGLSSGTSVNYSFTNTSWARVSKNGGSYSTSGGTVQNGDTLLVRITLGSTDRSTVLSVGTSPTVTDTFTAGLSSGSGLGVGGTTPNYGLKLQNSSGQTTFSPNIRKSRIVKSGTVVPTTGTGVNVSYSGVTTSNTSVYEIIVTPLLSGSLFTVHRLNGGWSIRANGYAFSVGYEVWRIG